MSACQEWRRASADELLEEGLERRRMLDHIAVCEACRRQALAIDPSLSLVDLDRPPVEKGETEALQHEVLALLRMRRVESSAPSTSPSWRSAAAALLVAGAAFLVPGSTAERQGLEPTLFSEDFRATEPAPTLVELVESARSGDGVETLLPAQPRIYQLEENFSLVMMVDESFDL